MFYYRAILVVVLATTCLLCANEESQSKEPSLSLKIVFADRPEDGIQKIDVRGDETHFQVVLKNTSDQDVKISTTSNSYKNSHLRFHVPSDDGTIANQMSNKCMAKSSATLDYALLKPGEDHAFDICFNHRNWVLPFLPGHDYASRIPLRFQAVYEVTKYGAGKRGVWMGTVESPEVDASVGYFMKPDANDRAEHIHFSPSKLDFGVVPVGTLPTRNVRITNCSAKPIRLMDHRITMGAYTFTPEIGEIQPGEFSVMKVKMNAMSFHGSKGSTCTLVFDRPYYTERKVHAEGYIRRDMVISKPKIELTPGDKSWFDVEIHYAGRKEWEITDIKKGKGIETKLKETLRDVGEVSQVKYQLSVRHVGDVDSESDKTGFLTLVTNDGAMDHVQVPLSLTP